MLRCCQNTYEDIMQKMTALGESAEHQEISVISIEDLQTLEQYC